MKITYRTVHACPGFIEYERVIRESDPRGSYRKYGYRRRLIDNGIYKRGERYGNYLIWGSAFSDRCLVDAMMEAIDEAVKNSVLYKIIHGEIDVPEKPPVA